MQLDSEQANRRRKGICSISKRPVFHPNCIVTAKEDSIKSADFVLASRAATDEDLSPEEIEASRLFSGEPLSFSGRPREIDFKSHGAAELGLGAGGKIRQEIVEDLYGAETWDEQCSGKVSIRIVNSAMFKLITGMDAPPTPLSAADYTKYGLPWFDYYDEAMPALLPSGILAKIKPIAALDKLKGVSKAGDHQPVQISPDQVRRIAVPTQKERIEFLHNNAEASWLAGRFEIAKRQTDLILEMNPQDARAFLIRADCNLELHRWIQAECDASDSLTIAPDAAFPWQIRAKANLMLGEFIQAVSDASEALQKKPTYRSDTLAIRAEAYLRLDLFKKALSDTSAIIEEKPADAWALSMRAACNWRLGNNQQAIEDATASLNIELSIFALNFRADASRLIGNHFDARRDAEEVLRLNPGDTFATGILEKLPTR